MTPKPLTREEIEELQKRELTQLPFYIAISEVSDLIATALVGIEAREALDEIQMLVNVQAEDDGLWFQDMTCSEAYLQQELRKLHALIESAALHPDTEQKEGGE